MNSYNGTTTITLRELMESIQRLLVSAYYNPKVCGQHKIDRVNGTTKDLANNIIEDVLSHREPEWKPGDIVVDAKGRWFRRTAGGLGWSDFNGTYQHDSTPTRPLQKHGNDASPLREVD